MSDYHSYTPAEGHRLKHSPFKALIAPRPIGWISTMSRSGAVNLAPYSFFNAFCERPPILGFCSFERKDSLINIEETGEFVHNLAPAWMLAQMNQTSGNYAHGINEMVEAGLDAEACDSVAPPRIANAPAAMECKLIEIKRLTDASGGQTECYLVMGEVVRIHIAAEMIHEGIIDEEKLQLLGRLGGFNYTKVTEIFSLKRPKL